MEVDHLYTGEMQKRDARYSEINMKSAVEEWVSCEFANPKNRHFAWNGIVIGK